MGYCTAGTLRTRMPALLAGWLTARGSRVARRYDSSMGTKPKDAALLAAQRDFDCCTEDTSWALKPGEHVCPTCHLVQPCDCGAY